MKWPTYTKQEISTVTSIIRSGKVNYWTGKEVKIFEKEFSKYIGSKYSVAVCNASLALEASLNALNIGKGDEVITTPRSYNSSATCILRVGATPIFADVDIKTQNISVDEIKKKISKKTKAIICVHLGGLPCEMDKINKLVKNKKIAIIEDCSQAHGAKYKGQSVGTFSDISVWSFCNDKIISTLGEGGMISTKKKDLFLKIWSFKEIGKNYYKANKKFEPKYKWLHDNLGTNLRMTEVQAAVGISQLKRLNKMVNLRRNIAYRLDQFFENLENFYVLKSHKSFFNSYYRYYFFLKSYNKKKKEKIINFLVKSGCSISVGSCPEIYREKPFKKYFPKNFRLKNARKLGNLSLALSISHLSSNQEINKFCKKIKFLDKNSIL